MTARRFLHGLVRMATTGPPNRASRTEPTHHSRSEETLMMSVSQLANSANADVPPSIGQFAQQKLHSAILTLDLGTTTGWAIGGGNGHITSGTVSFRPSRYDGGGIRYLRFRSWLDQIAIDAGGIDAVYFEEVRKHAGTDAAHVYAGFLATLTARCEEAGIAYQGVPVGTIKRHVTGKGNADKAAVMAAIRTRGFDPADDNEADALATLLWVTETQGGVR